MITIIMIILFVLSAAVHSLGIMAESNFLKNMAFLLLESGLIVFLEYRINQIKDFYKNK